MLYIYYIKNLWENIVDGFFTKFNDLDIFSDLFNTRVFISEFSDIFKYLFNFQFEEFFFFLKHFFFKNKKKYSLFFYFFSLLLDVYTLVVSYTISHLWLSTKIFADYVHNDQRRDFLKILTIFFLIFSFILIFFYFYI